MTNAAFSRPLVRIVLPHGGSVRLASSQGHGPGSLGMDLTEEAERLGKITVGTELGWGRAINPEGVRCARHGVRAAAIHHGLLRGQIEPHGAHRDGTQQRVAMVDRACFSPAPFAGHYEPLLECGTAVRLGQVIGLLHDFDYVDATPQPVVAGVDGVIIAQAWAAAVPEGQHIAVVGRIQLWTSSKA
jgi:N-alpha-acetyl-L-2,4-diaminobutyrate deacetylase